VPLHRGGDGRLAGEEGREEEFQEGIGNRRCCPGHGGEEKHRCLCHWLVRSRNGASVFGRAEETEWFAHMNSSRYL